MEEKTFILGALVDNEFGVLTRVAGMFARRGYNIDSLTVGPTEDAKISRMTIVSKGDEYIKGQITKQLMKLNDVKQVTVLSDEPSVTRELMLVKVAVGQERHREIMEAVKVYRAKVIDLCAHAVTIEITGEVTKLDAFVDYMRPYGIAELTRTGATTIQRGEARLVDNSEDMEERGAV